MIAGERARGIAPGIANARRTTSGRGNHWLNSSILLALLDCEVEIVGNKWDNPELLEVE
jgi:hypothetical protein